LVPPELLLLVFPPDVLAPAALLLLPELPQPAMSAAAHARIAPVVATFVCTILLLDVCFPQSLLACPHYPPLVIDMPSVLKFFIKG